MIDKNLEYIENIFHVAITLNAAERASYLAQTCGDDVIARQEVESLVSAYEGGDGLLNENAVTLGMRVLGSIAEESITGKQIGSYKILGFLGKGGMGEVYLAEDSVLNRKVALKFLSGEFIEDSWAKRQLIKEAQAVAMLDHPNICAVYGFEEVDEHSFIVMQYIEGRTLAELVRAKSVTASQIVPIAQQIVSALTEAHARGIIHRDIKPKNIMVTESGQVKVLDFGLAKTIHQKQTFEDATESISQLSKTGLLIGTIAYMSPEQLRGERLDYRSDIFSLGTLLYEMACGKNPYAHETNAEVISAIMRGEVESLRQAATECPRGLDRVVDKCLMKDRDQRYQSASELLLDLEKLHKGMALPPSRQAFLNVRSAAVVALLLLVFVVVMSIYRAWTSGGDQTLAVLPIVCEGVEPNTPCVGPMMTENLVRTLSRRTGLRVTSSQVVPSLFGPQGASPEKVGRDLNADSVLFGRIRRGESGLVLTIRLQRVIDGSRIAEETYNLNPDKLSLLEQRLSLETAYYLQLPMNEDDKNLFSALAAQQNRSAEAMELYFSGRVYWSRRDGENIQKAIDSFLQATEKDPLYAKAYAGLADCYVLMNTVAYGSLATKDAMKKAEWAAKKALEVDDNLAEAHNAYASVLMKGHWDWENAEKEFKRAIALNPDYSPAHWGYSILLAVTGRINESVAESEAAKDQDPFSAPAIMNYCRTLYFARQFEQANVCLDRLAQEQPNYLSGKYIHGAIYIQLGKLQEATRIYEEFYVKNKALGGAMLGFCYGISNRRVEAEKILSEMQELQKQQYLPPQELAIIYFGLNDLDHAFPLLRKSAEERFPPTQTIFVDPMFDRYRSDARFIELARELKLPLHAPTLSAASNISAK